MSDTTTTARPSLAATEAVDGLLLPANPSVNDVTISEHGEMVTVTMPLDWLERIVAGVDAANSICQPWCEVCAEARAS